MKCLVSGATGFIGRQLCQQLLERGDDVVALSKTGASLADGAPTLALDLAARDPDVECLRGVDVVFHLAGVAHQQAEESVYQALNYRATMRLARLAGAAGVRCFIFLSSVKAMGAPVSDRPRSEGDCTLPADAYGLSKWQAECDLREEFSSSEMAVVILRPTLVYGAHAKGNLSRLAKGVRRGLPRPPQGGARSMIAVQDLAELLCIIARNPPCGVHTWIVCDASAYSTRIIYDLLRTANGRGRGVGWLPRWGWRVGAALLDIASGRRDDPTFDKLFGAELYSNAALLAGTDWQPRVTLGDVIGGLAADGMSVS